MIMAFSKEKLKKMLATATLTAFATAGMGIATVPAFAADSTHITEAQQATISDDSWIAEQTQKEAAMEKAFQAGKYTAEAPYVVVDPYGNNPLSALVMFKTDAETKVSVTVEVPKDKSGAYDKESTFTYDFSEYAKDHYVPVYALYDGKNIVSLTVTDKNGTAKTYQVSVTTKVPEVYNVAAETLVMEKDATMAKGLNFVSYVFSPAAKVVAYDFNGNYRAVFTNAGQSKIYDLPNGHIAFEDNNVLHGLYYTSAFLEVDMMGKVYNRTLVNGIHHEFVQLENGNMLVDGELPDANTTEDYFVELDKETGMPVRDWWLKDSMDMNVYQTNPFYNNDVVDWAHVNSLAPVPGEDRVWFSARQNDGMYLLNLTTNKIDAVIAEDDEDYGKNLKAARLTPVITQKDGSVITVDEWWKNNKAQNPSGAAIDWHNPQDPYFKIDNCPFEYTYGQHGISLLPNGDIFVFDNGCGRSKEADKMITAADTAAAWDTIKASKEGSAAYKEAMATNYSRAVIYHYDLEKGTVEQLWQYGKERGMELYSVYICDVDYIADGHYVFDFGGVRTSNNWADQSSAYARVIELKDNKVINEMNVGTNCYRAERLNPYFGTTNEYELNKVQGTQKGELLMQRAVLPGADTKTTTMKLGAKEYIDYNGGHSMDTAVYLDENNRTMIPVRYAAKALNAKVDWDSATQTATIEKDGNVVAVKIGESVMTVNGKEVPIDTKAVIKDNRTMLQVRAVAQALGCEVEYANGVVTITK